MDETMEETMPGIVMEDCHSDANKEIPSAAASSSSSKNVLDVEKLFNLLEASKNAGNLIAGKDVMLLIGLTGAGKVRKTLIDS